MNATITSIMSCHFGSRGRAGRVSARLIRRAAQQDVEPTARTGLPSQVCRPLSSQRSFFTLSFAGIINSPAIAVISLCSAPLVPPSSSRPYPHPRTMPVIYIKGKQPPHIYSSCRHVFSPHPLPPLRSPKMLPFLTQFRLPLTRPRLN